MVDCYKFVTKPLSSYKLLEFSYGILADLSFKPTLLAFTFDAISNFCW
jgi:hypothetical protein